MGSLGRKLKREQEKKAYGNFGKAWRLEKENQERQLSKGEKLTNPKLGRKPPLGHWFKILERQRQVVAEQATARKEEQRKQDEKIDTSWDEPDGQETTPVVQVQETNGRFA